jgi:hypothetical protein
MGDERFFEPILDWSSTYAPIYLLSYTATLARESQNDAMAVSGVSTTGTLDW